VESLTTVAGASTAILRWDDMSDFKWAQRISSEEEVVDRFLYEGTVKPEPASDGDLETAIEWLALYGAGTEEEAQAYANVIGFLEGQLQARAKRRRTNDLKRAYAQYNGVSFKQVRIKK
jgi:hypothetical protein